LLTTLTSTNWSKIQILEIEKLITGGEAPRYPNLDAGALTFKRGRRRTREHGEDKQADLFAAPLRKTKKKKQS